MKHTRKVVENRAKHEESAEQGLDTYPTEEVLGTMTVIKEFAAFYALRKVDLEVIHAAMLLKFCENSYTKEEKDAFLKGLDSFLKFFESAEEDYDLYLERAKQKNKSV